MTEPIFTATVSPYIVWAIIGIVSYFFILYLARKVFVRKRASFKREVKPIYVIDLIGMLFVGSLLGGIVFVCLIFYLFVKGITSKGFNRFLNKKVL